MKEVSQKWFPSKVIENISLKHQMQQRKNRMEREKQAHILGSFFIHFLGLSQLRPLQLELGLC